MSGSQMLERSGHSDPLGEALQLLRLTGALYFQSELSAPWGFAMPALPGCVSFHVVTYGGCLLEVAGQPPMLLGAGDLVLLPLGIGHTMSSGAGVPTPPVEDLPHDYLSDRYALLKLGGGGDITTLFCGALQFGHPAAAQLVALLPAAIHLDTRGRPELEWMQSTTALLASEARNDRAGSAAMAMRLADLVVIQTIRHWMAKDPDAQTGWLAALRDEQIARAISLIHDHPSRAWTLASLAAEINMSRSMFSARFTELVNETAMQYVTRWKMQLGFVYLRDEPTSVANVAERLGYLSEASFSRAFKRTMGFSPGKAKEMRHQLARAHHPRPALSLVHDGRTAPAHLTVAG